MGWLLVSTAAAGGITTLAEVYAFVGLVSHTVALPGAAFAYALSDSSWVAAFATLTAMVVLFPHGRLPSKAWRPFGWVSTVMFGGA